MDLAAIMVTALGLYLATLLPGIGWGAGARLQTQSAIFPEALVAVEAIDTSDENHEASPRVSPFFAAPARLFLALVPFGSPAWRVNLLMAFAAAVTLIIVYGLLRQIVARALAATMAAAALAFSHAFFLHAVQPSLLPVLALLLSLLLLLAVRHLLMERGREAAFLWILLGVMAAIESSTLFSTLPAALYVTIRRFWKSPALFPLILLPLVVTQIAVSDFGLAAPVLLGFFAAFQFPIVGWLLIILGYRLLARRARPILELALLVTLGGAPLMHGLTATELMGSMLLSSLGLVILLGTGAEHLLERIASRTEPLPSLVPLLFASLVLFPLLVAVSAATLVRATGLDTRLAIASPTVIRLRDNPWNDAVWYALWPPKNGLGGGLFIAEAERILPADGALLVDPEVAAALDFAQRVEGRLAGIRPVRGAQEDQMAHASLLAAEGRRIFLAGNDPAFYDIEGLGRMGVLIEQGRFYEWIPSAR
jgi:hypothetical protein